MPDLNDSSKSLILANDAILDLAGEDVDAIEVKSVRPNEAAFLAKVVSKLSPMVGNLMEQRIVALLDQNSLPGFRWQRQDPGFPDAILTTLDGTLTETGIEIKAWYVLSSEITGRFKESQNLLEARNISVALVAWCLSHVVFGKPRVLGVLTVSGSELAASRDNHYHQPRDYSLVEPHDTSNRSINLQQSNVNGFRLQEAESDASALAAVRAEYKLKPKVTEPHSAEAQAEARSLMNRLVYRSDTNFAKIDRVGNREVEAFKRRILSETYLGKSFAEWAMLFRQLDSTNPELKKSAEGNIVLLYDKMLRTETETGLAFDL